jgi:hypothetical protein
VSAAYINLIDSKNIVSFPPEKTGITGINVAEQLQYYLQVSGKPGFPN